MTTTTGPTIPIPSMMFLVAMSPNTILLSREMVPMVLSMPLQLVLCLIQLPLMAVFLTLAWFWLALPPDLQLLRLCQ